MHKALVLSIALKTKERWKEILKCYNMNYSSQYQDEKKKKKTFTKKKMLQDSRHVNFLELSKLGSQKVEL